MNQDYVNLTQAISGIITLLVTCLGVWIAYKALQKNPEQRPVANTSLSSFQKERSCTSMNSEYPNELMVFETKFQRTKLISTEKGLECYLYDLRPEKESGLQWQLSIDKIKQIQEKKDFSVTPGFRISSGDFSIGPFKKWHYSKKIFPNPEKLRDRLESMMILLVKN